MEASTRWGPLPSERDRLVPPSLSRWRSFDPSAPRTRLRWPLARRTTKLVAWLVTLALATSFGVLAPHFAPEPADLAPLLTLGLLSALCGYGALAVTLDEVELDVGSGRLQVRVAPLPLPWVGPHLDVPLSALSGVRIQDDDVLVIETGAGSHALPRSASPEVARAVRSDVALHVTSKDASRPAVAVPWAEVLLRIVGALGVVGCGVAFMIVGSQDFDHPVFSPGNGPMLPLWFIGPALIAIGLGALSASRCRGRFVERAFRHGLAWFGLLATLLSVLMIVSIWFACAGVLLAPIGVYMLIRGVVGIVALAPNDE